MKRLSVCLIHSSPENSIRGLKYLFYTKKKLFGKSIQSLIELIDESMEMFGIQ